MNIIVYLTIYSLVAFNRALLIAKAEDQSPVPESQKLQIQIIPNSQQPFGIRNTAQGSNIQTYSPIAYKRNLQINQPVRSPIINRNSNIQTSFGRPHTFLPKNLLGSQKNVQSGRYLTNNLHINGTGYRYIQNLKFQPRKAVSNQEYFLSIRKIPTCDLSQDSSAETEINSIIEKILAYDVEIATLSQEDEANKDEMEKQKQLLLEDLLTYEDEACKQQDNKLRSEVSAPDSVDNQINIAEVDKKINSLEIAIRLIKIRILETEKSKLSDDLDRTNIDEQINELNNQIATIKGNNQIYDELEKNISDLDEKIHIALQTNSGQDVSALIRAKRRLEEELLTIDSESQLHDTGDQQGVESSPSAESSYVNLPDTNTSDTSIPTFTINDFTPSASYLLNFINKFREIMVELKSFADSSNPDNHEIVSVGNDLQTLVDVSNNFNQMKSDLQLFDLAAFEHFENNMNNIENRNQDVFSYLQIHNPLPSIQSQLTTGQCSDLSDSYNSLNSSIENFVELASQLKINVSDVKNDFIKFDQEVSTIRSYNMLNDQDPDYNAQVDEIRAKLNTLISYREENLPNLEKFENNLNDFNDRPQNIINESQEAENSLASCQNTAPSLRYLSQNKNGFNRLSYSGRLHI